MKGRVEILKPPHRGKASSRPKRRIGGDFPAKIGRAESKCLFGDLIAIVFRAGMATPVAGVARHTK
jgi:hypothetical protein